MRFAGVLHKTFHTEEEMIIYSAQMSGFCREQEGKKGYAVLISAAFSNPSSAIETFCISPF